MSRDEVKGLKMPVREGGEGSVGFFVPYMRRGCCVLPIPFQNAQRGGKEAPLSPRRREGVISGGHTTKRGPILERALTLKRSDGCWDWARVVRKGWADSVEGKGGGGLLLGVL